MFLLKNNKLKKHIPLKLCKLHNDKKKSKTIAKIFTHKSSVSTKVFYFLKNKKKSEKNSSADITNNILSKRYSSILLKNFEREWVNETEVISWLEQIGIEIKKISSENYLVNGRPCSFIQLLIFTNKKRTDMGLNPFCVKGLTED